MGDTDRELLELAAKAAGIEGKWGQEGFIEKCEGFIPKGWRRAWTPLNSNSDAFFLQVKMRFEVSVEPDFTSVVTECAQEFVERANDPWAATRRAITRAAAEIGRAA